VIIDSRLAAAMARREGRQALGVEAGDQVRDGVAGATTRGASGQLIIAAARNGQEHGGPSDLHGGCGVGPAELGQGLTLGVAERPERILLAARHDSLRVTRGRPS
jgi:hypothetical protein